jgi:ferredoxin
MCEHFVAERADIAIGLIGLNVGTQLLIEAREDLAEKMRLMPGTVERRGKALARLNAIRKHRREQALEDAARWLSNVPALVGFLGQCDACGKCLSVCPFHTTTFQPAATEPSTERAGGALDVLTELGRRATVCVGCGMCESACGHHIPLTAIQGLLGQQVRAEFNYGTGRSVKEVLPWAVT